MLQLSRSAKSITARGVVAASLVAAAYAVTPTSAAAGERLPADCAKAGNELAQLKCGTNHYRERRLAAEADRAASKARGTAADVRGAAADVRGAAAEKKIAIARDAKKCTDDVTRDIQAATKFGPLSPGQVKTFESRIAGCEQGPS